MGYLIGTDEAGYGPNLGPLVISATVWEVPDGVGGDDLFDRLGHVVAGRSTIFPTTADRAWPWPTRKCSTPRATACGTWNAGYGPPLGLLEHRPRTWRHVWHCLAPQALARVQSVPWYADFDVPVPLDCDAEEIGPLVAALQVGLAAADVRLLAVASRAIFEEEFNELVERHGSKGTAVAADARAGRPNGRRCCRAGRSR